MQFCRKYDRLPIQRKSFPALMICPENKYQQKENLRNLLDNTDLSQININQNEKKDIIDTWIETPFSDSQHHDQFFYNKEFYQENQNVDKYNCTKELIREHVNKFDETQARRRQRG